jgi:hypothetical protein
VSSEVPSSLPARESSVARAEPGSEPFSARRLPGTIGDPATPAELVPGEFVVPTT